MTEREIGKWDLEMFLKVLRSKKQSHQVSWFPIDDTYHVRVTISKDDKLDIVSDEYGNFKRPAYLVNWRDTETAKDVKNFNDAYTYIFGE